MQTIAIVNEKGGTGKTTTAVNLAAALGLIGRKVLLVDLDGQAASSRWLGVEDDDRLAKAMLAGGGLEPLEDVLEGVSLAPASGMLDSVAHELRPTQGGQLRKVLAALQDRYDYVLIDCPPSLGNRLIGNALLSATHAIVPVEPSILALDGLRILLTTLADVRDGFDHDIELIGVVACRYETRTRLSRLVLAELNRALPGKVFKTVIRETVRMQECPVSGMSIFGYAPKSHAAEDYLTFARELESGGPHLVGAEVGAGDLAVHEALSDEERAAVMDFRKQAAAAFCGAARSKTRAKDRPQPQAAPKQQSQPVEGEPPVAGEQIQIAPPPAPVQVAPQHSEPQSAGDDYFAEMPDVYVPSEPAAPAPRRPAETPVAQPASQEAGPDLPDNIESVIVMDEADEPAEYSYDDDDRWQRQHQVRVAGMVGVCVLIGAAAIGWFALRPTSTTLRATADYGYRLPYADLAPEAVPISDADASALLPVEPADAPGPAEAPKPAQFTVIDEDVLSDWIDETPPAQSEAPAVAAPQISPADFTVSCVVLGSTGGRAIINGQTVSEGDQIGGAKVVAIMAQAVQMEAGGQKFTLAIDGYRSGSAPESAETDRQEDVGEDEKQQ